MISLITSSTTDPCYVTQAHHADSDPTSFYSYSLLCTQSRSSKSTCYSLWLKSYLSLVLLYRYVAAWKVWWNPNTGHMRVTYVMNIYPFSANPIARTTQSYLRVTRNGVSSALLRQDISVKDLQEHEGSTLIIPSLSRSLWLFQNKLIPLPSRSLISVSHFPVLSSFMTYHQVWN